MHNVDQAERRFSEASYLAEATTGVAESLCSGAVVHFET
jgi:hypothetical protein